MSKLAADLAAAFEDKEICDITLQGTDGEEVPASRFLLAARSKVFRTLLFAGTTKAETTPIVSEVIAVHDATAAPVLPVRVSEVHDATEAATTTPAVIAVDDATATAPPVLSISVAVAAAAATLVSAVHNATSAPASTDSALSPADEATTTAAVHDALAAAAEALSDVKESEAVPTTISLGYSSTTIERIVHYCYTDKVMDPLEDCSEEKVRDMVRLRCAAHFLELNDLEDKIITIISKHMAIFPSLACAVLDEESTAEADGILSEVALGIIGLRAEESLLPTDEPHEGGVFALSASVLERVWKSEVVAADNFVKYRSLQGWCGEITPDGGSQETSGKEQEERTAIAKDLAKGIDLRLIKASDLAGITGSKLVTKDQLIDAFKAHALSAEEEGASGSAARHDTKGASVLVTGAGVPEVNGKYFEDGKCDGVVQYTREGMWGGESGKFMLYRAKGNPSKKRHWFMDWEEINIFVSELDESGIDRIPHSTWKSNNVRSIPPMPRALFVPSCKNAN